VKFYFQDDNCLGEAIAERAIHIGVLRREEDEGEREGGITGLNPTISIRPRRGIFKTVS
jgi:hypothetical protein